MCRINFTTLSLILVLWSGSLMSEPSQNADGSIKGLYEYLLQREYAAPVSYADHQIKRKAVRSPSLRLRFGRRSDPSVPVEPEDDDMVDQRSIRAPQLRLRFGRTDPLWSSFNENALLEEKRAPSQRLRWGRSGGGMFSTNDVMQQKAIRAPQLRLRFGRSDPSWAMFNEHQLDEQQFADATRQPSKTLRGDEPTSIESTEQVESEENSPSNMDEK
ncbi:short neuropeptide F [Aedes aegypti]|uniref:Short neuropeptide F n=1 Tax=Aedes aegypti TaxID=7159 RepID=SNPF_AEDAE|nr:short neuropeptide F [Aedes aegypti]XP_021700215.1 short neuropeptide F [Aedes aegypti]A0SIX6.2 RecName: Full=Short neuropeptide F; Contains: RecName: Full=sNPF-associated peptide; Contains: RecName: Full=sNPF peptide 2; Contains: RecName: Full=sNPF peptide 3; Contains: RecName: Full=RLRF peptide 1; Contains: RecName: Full=RLRF peptide 2; Contains: RecName: Full=RLRF peptide 3; Contains: RecName: Full=RLRW peptide; Flags: Precursor [Aedes aegypti]